MIKTNFDLSEQARTDALAVIAAETTDQLAIDEEIWKGFVATGLWSGNYPIYKNFFVAALNGRANLVRLKSQPVLAAPAPAVTPATPEPAPSAPAV